MRDAEGLQAAKRATIAFHYPKDLESERSDLMQRMGVMPSVNEALERGRKMLEDLRQIDVHHAAAGSGRPEA